MRAPSLEEAEIFLFVVPGEHTAADVCAALRIEPTRIGRQYRDAAVSPWLQRRDNRRTFCVFAERGHTLIGAPGGTLRLGDFTWGELLSSAFGRCWAFAGGEAPCLRAFEDGRCTGDVAPYETSPAEGVLGLTSVRRAGDVLRAIEPLLGVPIEAVLSGRDDEVEVVDAGEGRVSGAFPSGGVLLRASWALDPCGLLDALGVGNWSWDSIERRHVSEVGEETEGTALAFVGSWTCVLDHFRVYDSVMMADAAPSRLEQRCLELAPEALLWLYERHGDTYGFVRVTEGSRRARRFADGRWELDVGEPLPFERALDPSADGEQAVDAAIEACLGHRAAAIALDPRRWATVF